MSGGAGLPRRGAVVSVAARGVGKDGCDEFGARDGELCEGLRGCDGLEVAEDRGGAGAREKLRFALSQIRLRVSLSFMLGVSSQEE